MAIIRNISQQELVTTEDEKSSHERLQKRNVQHLWNLLYFYVPPKGSIAPQKVGIKSLVQTVDPIDPKVVRLSQNGVKFRSLCPSCNNYEI